MTYNQDSYTEQHPSMDKFRNLEDLIGKAFENFISSPPLTTIQELVSQIKEEGITIKLYTELTEVRLIKFTKHILNGDPQTIASIESGDRDNIATSMRELKIEAVKAQNFELAAYYRDCERSAKTSKEPIPEIPTQKLLKTAIEVADFEISIYLISAFLPFIKMMKDLLSKH